MAEASKQFEDAFEELLKSNPVRQWVKPQHAPKQKARVRQLPGSQNGKKIKAIFDQLKLNSSMSSDLNSSIVTSNISFCDADIESQGGEDCENARGTDCQAVKPNDGENDTEHLQTEISNSVDQELLASSAGVRGQTTHSLVCSTSHASDATPHSPHDRGDNSEDTQHKRLADHSKASYQNKLSLIPDQSQDEGIEVSAAAGLSEHDCDKPHSSQASPLIMSQSSEVDCSSRDMVDNSYDSDEDDCGPLTMAAMQCTKTQGASLGTASQHENLTELNNEKPNQPPCDSSAMVQNTHSAGLSTSTRISPLVSTTAVEMNANSQADQETMELVSKLVLRLNSSPETGLEDDDGLDAADSTQGATTDYPRVTGSVDKNAQLADSALPDSVSGQEARNVRKMNLRSRGSNKEGLHHNSGTTHNNKSKQGRAETELHQKGCQEEKSTKSAKQMPQKTHAMNKDSQPTRAGDGGRRIAKNGSVFQQAQQTNNASRVAVDVISRGRRRPVDSTKDPFSLDASDNESEWCVDGDTIMCASKKSNHSKLVSRKGTNSTKVAKHVVQEHGCPTTKTRKDKTDVLKLYSWSLQPVSRMNSVRIEGKLPNADYFWMTSVITERVSSRKLKSINGSQYSLIGCMSCVNTRAAGFSQEVTKLFRNGFPPDWKELLQPCVAAAESRARSLHKITAPNEPSKISARQEQDKMDMADKQCSTPTVTRARRQVSTDFSSPQQTGHNSEPDSRAIWTPRGVMSRAVEAGQIRRTQSGRCSIPPLARWAGQYMQRDDDGNITIGFASQAAEKHFAKMAEQELGAPVRMRNSPLAPTYRAAQIKIAGKEASSQQNTPHRPSATPSKRANHSSSAAGAKHISKGRGGQTTGRTRKTSGSEGRATLGDTLASYDCRVLCQNIDVDDFSKDVMTLVHSSKQMRQENAVKRKRTCYSNAMNNSSRRRAESRAVVHSDLEDEVDIAPDQITNAALKSGTSARMNSRQSRGRKQTQSVRGKKHQTTQSADSNFPGSKRKAKSHSTGHSSDEDVESSERLPVIKRGQQRDTHLPKQPEKRSKGSDSDSDFNPDFWQEVQLTTVTESDNIGRPRRGRSRKDKAKNSPQQSEVVRPRRGWPRKVKAKNSPSHSEGCREAREQVPDVKRGRGRPRRNITAENNASGTNDSEDDHEVSRCSSSQEVDTVHGNFSHCRAGEGRTHTASGIARKKKDCAGRRGKRKGEDASRTGGGPGMADAENMRPWSSQEIRQLHRGTDKVSSDHPQYWQAVSEYVGTRSPKECASFFLQDKPDRPTKPSAKQQKANYDKKTLVLKGKRGTLKRRRELRAILEQDSNNNKDNDDMFIATPFRTRKKAKMTGVDFSKTDEEVFGRNPDFFTPRKDITFEDYSAISHTPASSQKTPCVRSTHSPWLEQNSAQKKDVDQYLYRLKKKKGQPAKAARKKTAHCKDKDSGDSCVTTLRLFAHSAVPSGDLFQISEERSSDEEEEEEDYYYSDEN